MSSPAVIEFAVHGQASPSRAPTMINMKATGTTAEIAATCLFGFLFI
jgi:hypothetical protein